MASTYSPHAAFEKAHSYVKDMPLREVQVRILDQISKMIWMAAPWRWSIGDLPVTTLAADTTDYSIAIPSDFLYATDAFYTDKALQTHPLLIEPALPADVGVPGLISRIAITGTPGSTGTLRIAPKTGTTIESPAPVIISLYKKTSPILSESNIHTPGIISLPDEWFWVFEEGVLWQAYLWGDDTRAGGATVSEDRVQYQGQYANFMAALIQMRAREKLPVQEPVVKHEDRKTRG
jgi:hypothetical protein